MTCSVDKFHTYECFLWKNAAPGVHPRGSTPRGDSECKGPTPGPPPIGVDPQGAEILIKLRLYVAV